MLQAHRLKPWVPDVSSGLPAWALPPARIVLPPTPHVDVAPRSASVTGAADKTQAQLLLSSSRPLAQYTQVEGALLDDLRRVHPARPLGRDGSLACGTFQRHGQPV